MYYLPWQQVDKSVMYTNYTGTWYRYIYMYLVHDNIIVVRIYVRVCKYEVSTIIVYQVHYNHVLFVMHSSE